MAKLTLKFNSADKKVSRISAEDFVIAYAGATCWDDVCAATGLTRGAAYQRYKKLVRHGVKLPQLGRKPRFDETKVAELNALFKKYRNK